MKNFTSYITEIAKTTPNKHIYQSHLENLLTDLVSSGELGHDENVAHSKASDILAHFMEHAKYYAPEEEHMEVIRSALRKHL
jgi:hypothetical protein